MSASASDRSAQRDLVRRGYDAISHAYRTDDGSSASRSAETADTYLPWLRELAAHLPAGGSVLDLGCGAGVPADRWLVDAGLDVTGVDFSEVQIRRARKLVLGASFLCADLTEIDFAPASFDAIVSFYSLIHVPLEDQWELLPRLRRWLRPAGLFLAIVGASRWSGTEEYFGVPMFWDHADETTYLARLESEGFDTLWHRVIPEGDVEHALVLAQIAE